MNSARVILIGGPPGAGKTTLGCALAARIGGASITIDDLMTVAKTATTPKSHPGLYLFRSMSFAEYFTNSTLQQFQQDADRQHEAVWPFVKALIEKHFDWSTTPIVIDGWHLRPHLVAELDREFMDACWIFIDSAALEQRERKNQEFYNASPDPKRMFDNFLARSLWYNDLTKAEAEEHGISVIHQAGETSVDDLCDIILANGRQRESDERSNFDP